MPANGLLTVRQVHACPVLELVLCEAPGVTVVGVASETEELMLEGTAWPIN